MTEENALTSILAGGNVSKYATDEAKKVLTKSGDYLPYFALFGGNSKLAKQGKIPIGHYGIVDGEKVIDLGSETVIIGISWRPKAMDFSGDTPQAYFDPNDPAFEAITANPKGNFGPEILIWSADAQMWAAYHMMNKSSRRASAAFMAGIDENGFNKIKAVTKLVEETKTINGEKREVSYHVPVAQVYELDVEAPEDNDANRMIVHKFKNPPAASGPERVEESERE